MSGDVRGRLKLLWYYYGEIFVSMMSFPLGILVDGGRATYHS